MEEQRTVWPVTLAAGCKLMIMMTILYLDLNVRPKQPRVVVAVVAQMPTAEVKRTYGTFASFKHFKNLECNVWWYTFSSSSSLYIPYNNLNILC